MSGSRSLGVRRLGVRRPGGLGERISAARRRAFVGRAEELEAFRGALVGDGTSIVYLHGPGGTGKTALLAEFAAIAVELGAQPVLLDARACEATPDGLTEALREALGASEDDGLAALESLTRPVVMIDSYEQIAVLDAWVRQAFLSRLPEHALVVVASRTPPSPGWRSDPGLSALSQVVSVRNLPPDDSRDYLLRRGVPAGMHGGLIEATRGHPLALALFADLASQQSADEPPSLDRHPDIVHALLERFVSSVPDPSHWEALCVCAVSRVTTEALLTEVLDDGSDQHELFEWVGGLSFIEHGAGGLFPHDTARDVLEAEFRWRNPDRFRELYQRVRKHVLRRLRGGGGRREQQLLAYDKVFLHKRSPFMRPYFDFAAMESANIEPAAPGDYGALLDILRRHESEESAAIAARWMDEQPGAFQVWRSGDGALQGLMAHLSFEAPTGGDLEADPAIAGIWAHIRREGDLRPGESFLVHRFWAGREGYQDAASQSVIAASASLLWMTTPNLAWSFPCTADPDHWEPMFTYCSFTREPSLDFAVGAQRFGVFAHDWRREPPVAWLDALSERELSVGLTLEAVTADRPPPLVVLSRPDFTEAVRQALRDYARPAALASNPLVRSRLVGTTSETPATGRLCELLEAAARDLQGTPRNEKRFRAVWHTYFQPAESQELAAEYLGLPFSTYRYHLKGGIEHIVDSLWQIELGLGASGPHGYANLGADSAAIRLES